MTRNWLHRIVRLAAVCALFCLAYDVYVPAEVRWQAVSLQVDAADRAEGLVLQHETGRDVWASHGWSIYRSRNGEAFERVYTLWPRLGEAWGGFSRTLRRRFGYQELVEVLPVGEENLVVFGGGDVWRVDLTRRSQELVHTLRFYGRGQGRGVMPHGVVVDPRGTIYYGEYPTRLDGPPYSVRVWRGEQGGQTWSVAAEFEPGAVRHVHAVEIDPVDGALWVATGDRDSESRIGWSRDGGRSFDWVGMGSQRFRACSLLFFPRLVVWGTDADRSQNYFLRWHRSGAPLEQSAALLPAPTYYTAALSADLGLLASMEFGAAVFAVSPEGTPREILRWTVPPGAAGKPHAGVRLGRRGPEPPSDDRHFLVNPLRTAEDEAAIYRVPVELARRAVVGAATAPDHPLDGTGR